MIDFKRAILSKRFLVVCIFGILISTVHFYYKVILTNAYNIGPSGYYNPFMIWISKDVFSIYAQIFLNIFPILASIVYSDSYWIDKYSGFIKNIYTRAKKVDYLISKYLTIFVVGGVSVSIPLLCSLLLMFMSLPAVTPSVFSQFDLSKDMFGNLFYNHPYIYIWIYLFLNFVFGGLCSTLGLAISTFSKNRFLAILGPLIVYLSMYMLETIGFPQLVPSRFLSAGQPVSNININSIIVIFIIFFTVSIGVYYLGANKNENV